ncbi:tetratricopeptide repeat-containing sulfotransferase family protein [uncultured Litoreibacter sp.]|uniref:tetratricopeptide repeat-containing sulfotransferase family protein n=1 Tax=uncultured Litoreibacter sp. TaxID=1392394 RepID=UPI0026255583|nr:tetratricopeptide repeat-containing sulfotransferase family protein [uncultured Litoreibacter sp.]
MSATATPDDPTELAAVNEQVQRIIQHQQAGRVDEAGEAIDGLLAQYEDHPRLIHLKGLNKSLAGDRAAGRALLESVLAYDMSDVGVLIDYGGMLANDGEVDKAIQQFQMAVEISPNYALARANLGAAQVVEKQYERAIPNLEKAIELDGTVLDAHLNLAQAFIRTNRFDAAINALFRVLAIDPQSAAAHVNLSLALFRRERHEAAEHHARRAIELAPNAAEAWLNLGMTLAASGRMDEAADAYLKIAGTPPIGMAALTRLVYMRKTKADSPEHALLKRYEEQFDNIQNAEIQASLLFALGKASEDLGKYDDAFGYFSRANELAAESYPFDISALAARTSRMRSLATPDFIAKHRGAGISDLAPIFICGLPRSGTTLTEQMFSRHPQVQAGGEMAAVPYAFRMNKPVRDIMEQEAPDSAMTDDDLNRLAEGYISFVQREGLKTEFVTDKMPSNYIYIGLLALAFPRSKFLIMRRHPLDCLLSNFTQNFGQNQPFSTRIEYLASTYKEFDQIATNWASLLPDQVRELRYEDIVTDAEGQMRSALDFVGLPWDSDVLDHVKSTRQVNTASVSQVREPIYSSSVARWQRYGPLLKDLALELKDLLPDADLKACGIG